MILGREQLTRRPVEQAAGSNELSVLRFGSLDLLVIIFLLQQKFWMFLLKSPLNHINPSSYPRHDPIFAQWSAQAVISRGLKNFVVTSAKSVLPVCQEPNHKSQAEIQVGGLSKKQLAEIRQLLRLLATISVVCIFIRGSIIFAMVHYFDCYSYY